MEEQTKKIIKKLAIGFLKKGILILLPIIIIVFVIFGGGFYILTIEDGIWDEEKEKSPSSYSSNVKVTGNGLEVDKYAIIEEAMKLDGFTDEEIAQIRTDLQNEGYTGEELEIKIAQKELELLGISNITDISGASAAQLIWELESETYSKYLDDFEQLEYLLNAELVTQMPHIGNNASEDILNGNVYFDRHTLEGNTVRLQYIDEGSFNQLIESGDSTVLNYFTVSENGGTKIAYWSEESGQATINDDKTLIDISKYDSHFTNDKMSYTNTQYYATNVIYSIPEYFNLSFEYLWALLVITEDYDNFVKELAGLAYDSEIVISIYDSISEQTTEVNYSYSREVKEYSQVKQQEVKLTQSVVLPERFTINGWIIAPEKHISNSVIEGDNEIKEKVIEESIEQHSVHTKIVTRTNSVTYKLTYANVWIAEYSTQYNQVETGSQTMPTGLLPTMSTAQIENEEVEIEGSRQENQIIGDSIENVVIEPGRWNYIYKNTTNSEKEYYDNYVDIKNSTETTSIGNTWSTYITSEATIAQYDYSYSSSYVNDPSVTKKIEKTDYRGVLDENGNKVSENFCSLFRNSSKKEFLLDNREWFFEILEGNEETASMIEFTKYLLNKANDKKIFTINFNFDSIFNTTTIGTLYGNTAEEKIYFALINAGYSRVAAAGVIGNLWQESGCRSNNLQNDNRDEEGNVKGASEYTLGMTDEEYTEAVNKGTYTKFINDKGGYGIAQWTSSGRKQGLLTFAQQREVNIDDLNMQIEFLLGEMSECGGADGLANFQMSGTRGGYTYSDFINATDVEEATKVFCYLFERPNEEKANMNNRVARAIQCHQTYGEIDPPTSYGNVEIGKINLTGENKTKMQNMLQRAIKIANDDRYGYSIDDRYGEFNYDCSSFVKRLYEEYFGISLPGSTGQYEGNSFANAHIVEGRPENIELKPGDVLWWEPGKYSEYGHVTIYLGNGNYVAAKNPSIGIEVSSDNPSRYTRVYRFIE